jgi:hypothetical protein
VRRHALCGRNFACAKDNKYNGARTDEAIATLRGRERSEHGR